MKYSQSLADVSINILTVVKTDDVPSSLRRSDAMLVQSIIPPPRKYCKLSTSCVGCSQSSRSLKSKKK